MIYRQQAASIWMVVAAIVTGCGGERGEAPAANNEAFAQADDTAVSAAPSSVDAADTAAPAPMTIDDLDHLGPVSVVETSTGGLRAVPDGAMPSGYYVFVVPDGARVATYQTFAKVVAGLGWSADILPSDGATDRLEAFATPDQCTIFGSIGETSKNILDFGYTRRERVDGVILTGFARTDTEPYKKKLPIVLIVGGQDGVAPFDVVSQQYPIYPAQTYLLTIREANHSNYYDGQSFDADGAAVVSPDHQRLMLAEVTANMLDRLCLSRETRLADEARRAAREGALANETGGP